MNQYVDRVATVLGTVVAVVQSERITFIAASLAYYALISLLPLLLLVLVAASILGEPELIDRTVETVTTALGEQAGSLVREALVGAAGRGGATVVGVGVLLWSGLKLFRGLDIAFSEVYGAPGPESLLEQVGNAIVALSAVGIGIVITVLVGGLLAFLDVDAIVQWLPLRVIGTIGSVLALSIAFLPLYYLLPGAAITLGDALPGTVFAAVGWTALQTGFRLYTDVAANYEAYGVLGGVLLLVTWFYFGGLILLLGAVLNAVLAGRIGRGSAVDSAADPQPTAELEETMTADRIDDDDVSDAELREELERLYDELDRFEERIDERTVHRDEIERDLKRYVRARIRRGKARGWGPYLVLLYGTAMTIGAFFFLSSGWAVLAMIVIWLSTLGLYVLMLIVGATLGLAGLPGRLRDRF